MKITKSQLLEAGYKTYPTGRDPKYCNELFQKTIRKDDKKLYFINFYYYTFPTGHSSWDVEVMLYLSEEDYFQLNFMVRDFHELIFVESFYQKAYEKLGCIPDAHNN